MKIANTEQEQLPSQLASTGASIIDLSKMNNEEAVNYFAENAVVYTDTKGATRKLNGSFGNVVELLGTEFNTLVENVGSENVFIYSMNDDDQLLEGYRYVNVYCRFAATQHFKLPEDGIEL